MQEAVSSEHFIPFRKADVVQMCKADPRLSDAQRERFEQFAQMLSSIFHFEFHERLEVLKDLYAPMNPDSDTLPISFEMEQSSGLELKAELQKVLEAANFVRVTQEDLERAMHEESLFQIRLEANFDDFEEVLFFRRGSSQRTETLVKLLGLRKREIEFTNYDRVLVYVKFKDAEYFEAQEREDLPFVPGSTVLKLFQNIPKADLEMLFPNTEVRMKTIDKVMIGVPAVAGTIAMIVTKLAGTLLLVFVLIAFWLGLSPDPGEIPQKALVGLVVGIGTLAGYLWRQFGKFKNRKISFMKALTDNLYFKNLDNNSGVFHRLIDAAEEEECKESLLAYHALLLADGGRTEQELDQEIEQWFVSKWNCKLDFEADDALEKLDRLGLATRDADRFQAVALEEALARLDARWDGFFNFSAKA